MVYWDISLSTVLSVIALLLATMLYWYQRKSFRYWKDRGVQYIQPTWIFGSIKDPLLRKKTWTAFIDESYRLFKDKGFGGFFIFGRPALFVCDPGLIEKMLVQDFLHFHDRWSVGSRDILTKTLMYQTGERWRTMRHKLGQSFTSSKIKGMFEQIFRSGDYMVGKIDKITEKNEPVKVEPLLFVFVTEALSSCIFGVQMTSDSHQRQRIKEVVTLMHETSASTLISMMLALVYSKLFSLLKIRALPKKVTEFFLDLTRGAIVYRDLNRVKRNDFLQMVLALKDQEENGIVDSPPDLTEEDQILNQVRNIRKSQVKENIFTEDCIAALMMNFVFAGLKPSVVTIGFALYEIAKNQEIKRKLHCELDQTLSKHKRWTYEAIRELTYMDMVIQETLRRWNVNLVLLRQVTEDYKVPKTDLTLQKGTLVEILMSCLHMDPQYFPNPEEFIPERFTENSYKPTSTFMPFGQGPRICIGVRLAVTMMKVCLARILSEYQLEVSDKMTSPLVLDPQTYYPKVVGGTWLNFKRRS
ncbi:cytochrome P450 6B5-like [Macrosteles quadrilineatus]|uniref:cytochrome P450 6B5-like n=1 Tax=Macrosteles quadrilineatus TaxID=74068 RepID=UPI0023E1B25F|nr:cytochrome P450 6B5-like [Macrosteles quadrilineatus]